MKRIALIPSSSIPLEDDFHPLNFADEFVVYGNLRFTRRDWRKRMVSRAASP